MPNISIAALQACYLRFRIMCTLYIDTYIQPTHIIYSVVIKDNKNITMLILILFNWFSEHGVISLLTYLLIKIRIN